MTFEELGVGKEFFDRLSQKGILNPTIIQQEALVPIKEKKSLLGMAKTGTGKTLAYLLPLFDRGLKPEDGGIRILVLVPTRELASQVQSTVDLLSGRTDLGVVVVGGESEETQVRQSQKATFMIATPGRLLDLLKRKIIDLSKVETVVFDEADRLLDMGFVDDMRDIMSRITKPDQQLLFFSATTHFGIDEMAYEFRVQDLLRVGKESDELTVEGLDHRVAFVGEQEKFHALVHFLHSKKGERGIVFSNYRDKAHEVAGRLRKGGCPAEVLTAQLAQGARSRIMEEFRSGKIQVLIASDLAARGIDVSDVDFVVNIDLPDDSATYVHRVGRTARAGKKGVALSFVGFEDAFRLEKLERFLGKPIERHRFETSQLDGPLPRFADLPFGEEHRPQREERPREIRPQPNPRQALEPRAQRSPALPTARPAPQPVRNHPPVPASAPAQPNWWRYLMGSVAQFFRGLFGEKKGPPDRRPDGPAKLNAASDQGPRHAPRGRNPSHSGPRSDAGAGRRQDPRAHGGKGARSSRGSRNVGSRGGSRRGPPSGASTPPSSST